jgi:Fic family protein
MKKPSTYDSLCFLNESNKIESEFETDSLIQAMVAWEYLLKQKELSNGVILHIHKYLMLHSNLRPDQKGYYRDLSRVNVTIGGRMAPPYSLVPGLMDNWLLDYKDLTPKEAHIRFEHSHPFVDGNGRVGRMLYNWDRLTRGEELDIIYDEEKQDYYKWFN